jgi:molecular chaperone IbpA
MKVILAYRKEKKMTDNNQLTIRSFDIPQLHRFGVGFDRMFDRVDELLRVNAQQNKVNYPPYNMIRHSDDKFSIEIAVAGFKQGEVLIEVKETQLTITGKKMVDDTVDTDNREYVHRGISGRDFVRVFTLAEHVEVMDACQEDGILTVFLERKIPEEKKPKQIAITYVK